MTIVIARTNISQCAAERTLLYALNSSNQIEEMNPEPIATINASIGGIAKAKKDLKGGIKKIITTIRTVARIINGIR
jgi:hypothetical protein